MKLADKVERYLSSIDCNSDARAAECIGSRRRQLQHDNAIYCLLSNPEDFQYCPLQCYEASRGPRVLAECRLREYLDELASKNIVK